MKQLPKTIKEDLERLEVKLTVQPVYEDTTQISPPFKYALIQLSLIGFVTTNVYKITDQESLDRLLTEKEFTKVADNYRGQFGWEHKTTLSSIFDLIDEYGLDVEYDPKDEDPDPVEEIEG